MSFSSPSKTFGHALSTGFLAAITTHGLLLLLSNRTDPAVVQPSFGGAA